MNAQTNTGASGIEGTATVSPTHGGPSKLGEDDSAPMANVSFRVEAAGATVTTFKTDAKGSFKIDLPPGRYEIRIEQAMMKGRGCGLGDVEVTAGVFRKVHLDCDSGMR
ncbi:MAG TPA: carboxypeptidase-like regulatory domain-containing protein [Chthoniobacterales bacterium]|nr:carboxypeptidase-like regulatory domain-containing protein [Chthoniobacterales bacterium]